MKVSEAYGAGKFGLSFELFPPKTPAGDESMFAQLEMLMPFQPAYVTCTYGAGGSTRDKTLQIVTDVHRRHNCPVASHLTCVNATQDELRKYLAAARDAGIDNIVALRGDPPQGETTFQAVEGGLRYANELVALIKAEFPEFGIAVAGYPETHQEATDPKIDLENLKRKVDAGADIIITQLFYDNEDYFRFVDDCQELGIDIPIVPGILPVVSLGQIKRITTLCKARLPDSLIAGLEATGEDAAAQLEVGIEHATHQVEDLIARGVPGVHFYVLNKSHSTATILKNVGYGG